MLKMHLLYWAYIYIEIFLGIFLDYKKKAILRSFLRDIVWKTVNQVIPLWLKDTNLVSISVIRMRL